MTESRNRFFSKLASNIDSSGDVTAEAISPSVSLGITTYDSAKLLPLSGISSGDQALTLDTGRLYLSNGSGWFNQYASDVEVFARVYGFGKAFGSSGGAIVGNLELINLLKGTGRGYIYTTAPSPFSAHQVLKLLEKPEILENKRTALERLCIQADHFLPASESPWLRFLRCKEANAPSNLALKWFGPPTVPSEKCGYRIILHAHNSVEECEELKKWIWDAHPQYS